MSKYTFRRHNHIKPHWRTKTAHAPATHVSATSASFPATSRADRSPFGARTATKDGVSGGSSGTSSWASKARRLKDDPPLTPLHSTTPQLTAPCAGWPTSQTGHDNQSVRASHLTCCSPLRGFRRCFVSQNATQNNSAEQWRNGAVNLTVCRFPTCARARIRARHARAAARKNSPKKPAPGYCVPYRAELTWNCQRERNRKTQQFRAPREICPNGIRENT